jgi:hypothetical protein
MSRGAGWMVATASCSGVDREGIQGGIYNVYTPEPEGDPTELPARFLCEGTCAQERLPRGQGRGEYWFVSCDMRLLMFEGAAKVLVDYGRW